MSSIRVAVKLHVLVTRCSGRLFQRTVSVRASLSDVVGTFRPAEWYHRKHRRALNDPPPPACTDQHNLNSARRVFIIHSCSFQRVLVASAVDSEQSDTVSLLSPPSSFATKTSQLLGLFFLCVCEVNISCPAFLTRSP